MIDIQLLRLMRVQSDYKKIIDAIKLASFGTKTQDMIKAIGKYYRKHPTHGSIDFTVFIPFMDRSVFPDATDIDKETYLNIAKSMAQDYPDEDTRRAVIEGVHEYGFAHSLQSSIAEYQEGEEIDLVSKTMEALDKYQLAVGASEMPEVDENIDELLQPEETGTGLRWRLNSLNKATRELQGGDFGIIAARPDQGKTSFIASELTYMAPQTRDERPILWLNNEGPGQRIRLRLMQAALNKTFEELIELKNEGKLYESYWKAIGGKNRIRVMDIHGFTNSRVEALIGNTNPALIVYDMIDNVHGFGDAARTDLQLEKMYQWAREKAVKYDAVALATSQISSEGANMRFPHMSDLKDSRTGKQGACDFILMMGSLENNEDYHNRRWLSLPKNKLRKTNGVNLQLDVKFDKDRSRYKEIENVG